MVPFFRVAAPYYDADYTALRYDRDIQFYVDLAKEFGGPVLEMGCGTGRVLLPTARAGIAIHGLDLSGDMLAQLSAKLEAEPPPVQGRVSFTEGDLCTTDLGRQFTLITAPFRVVQALVERADQRAWLRTVRRHLAPGGTLCFDVFQPNFRYLIEANPEQTDVDRPDPATGGRVRRTFRSVPHPELQTLKVDFRWTHTDASGAKVSESSATVVLRWFTKGELENLLELEGFRITDYWGSFDKAPFGGGSPEQIIRATLEGPA